MQTVKHVSIANRAYSACMGNGPEASGDGWKYRGRGICEITGKTNYAKYGIANNEDEALEIDMSGAFMLDGMTNGKFTGKKLSDYFNADKSDWVGALRTVNGTDRAEKLAGSHALLCRT